MFVQGRDANNDAGLDDDDDDPSSDAHTLEDGRGATLPPVGGYGLGGLVGRVRERRPLLTYDSIPTVGAPGGGAALKGVLGSLKGSGNAALAKGQAVAREVEREAYDPPTTRGYFLARVLLRTAGLSLKLVKMLWVWLAVGLGLLALSFLFELLYPWDAEPEVLTLRSVDMLTIVQQWTDFLLGALRIAISIVRPLIPLWNSVSNYIFQPVIYIALEIVAMLIPPFFHHDVFFVMPDDPKFFKGFSCIGSETARAELAAKALADGVLLETDPDAAYTSMAWCGIQGWYEGGVTAMNNARRLTEEITERNGGWPPRSFEDASRLHAAAGGRVVLPLDVVERVTRRLQEVDDNWIDTEGRILEMIISILGTTVHQLVYIVSTIIGLIIYLLGSLSDMVFHVIYVLLDDVVYAFGEIFITIIKVMFKLILSLVSSGAITIILELALDFITIGVMDIAIPLMFVLIDTMMCAFHLFDPSSWSDELRCIDHNCFQPGSGGSSDLVVFTSLWIVLDEVFKIIQDTFTMGERLFNLGSANISSGKFWARAESAATNGTSGCAAYASSRPAPFTPPPP